MRSVSSYGEGDIAAKQRIKLLQNGISTKESVPFETYAAQAASRGEREKRLVADMVGGERPVVDPPPFHIARSSDGSKIRIAHWI